MDWDKLKIFHAVAEAGRHRLQRLRACLGRHPQPPPRRDGEGLRDRGLWRSRRGGALRRHVPRFPVRRPAAWRHGGWPRSHRDVAVRHHEFARDLAIPDEPAGGGFADGRAERADRKAVAGAACQGEPAEQVGRALRSGRRCE